MGNKIITGIIILAIFLIGGVFAVNRLSINTAKTISEISPSPITSTASGLTESTNETTITVSTSGFTPQTVTIKKGAKVIWENKSGRVADISSADHPTHLVYPPLNLGNFPHGQNLSLTFNTAGSYKYHNHLQPSQTGTIIVE